MNIKSRFVYVRKLIQSLLCILFRDFKYISTGFELTPLIHYSTIRVTLRPAPQTTRPHPLPIYIYRQIDKYWAGIPHIFDLLHTAEFFLHVISFEHLNSLSKKIWEVLHSVPLNEKKRAYLTLIIKVKVTVTSFLYATFCHTTYTYKI